MSKKPALFVAIVAMSLALAACSNDSQSDEPTPDRVKPAATAEAPRQAQPIATPPPPAATLPAEREFKPEMLVRFPQSAIACLSREGLNEAMRHGLSGEGTKLEAMMVGHPGGECIMLSPNKTVKLISVEYNSDTDIALLEVVGVDIISSEGAWALSIGAVPYVATEATPRR